MVKDESPQVRRQVAIALRGIKSEEAARLWATLADQYDGHDRWYLEALGISAGGNWDLYFNTWKSHVGADWKNSANRDIVWRSRSKFAIPMIAELIKESNENDMLRYYRALDFQTDPSKQVALAQLVQQTTGTKVLYALKHMDPSKLKMTPAIKSALNKVLTNEQGKIEFVELVTSFKLQDRSDELLHMALQYPDSLTGREAMRTLLAWDKTKLIQNALNSKKPGEPQAAITSLRPHMYNPKAIALVESVMMDSTRDIELKKLAVKNFGGPWQAEDRLLQLAKEGKIPTALHTAAGGVFQSAWRGTLRDEAASYLTLPGSKTGTPLPPISAMVDKKGDPTKGKEVFTALCSTCHRVNGAGTNFGPDLSGIGDKLSRDALYTSILFPDQGISFGYEGYKLTLNDGSTAVGRIVSETADKVELQYMGNQQTVQKSAITSRTKLDTSLMPSNLQSNMTEEELVNLVQFLSLLKDQGRISSR
jgi:putative heme-binding domain-containing protein